MNIWLIKIGEPVPLRENHQRYLRTALIADHLAARGHQVLWWTSTFDHASKSQAFPADQSYRLKDNFEIRFLRTPGYKRHVSVARLRDHLRMEKKLAASMNASPPPDLILSSLPVPSLCFAAARYARAHHVPLIVDIRDLWPDIFWYSSPRPIRWLFSLAMFRMNRHTKEACRSASALVGINRDFVEWGTKKAHRGLSEDDKDFPLAYPRYAFPVPVLRKACAFWRSLGVEKREGVLIVSFIGLISKRTYLDPVLKAASILNEQNRGQFIFVLGGDGDDLPSLRKKYRHLSNVIFSGWINAEQIHTLLQISDIGLNRLWDREDFLKTINNKAIEYMSFGLPVLSSPNRGALHEFLIENGNGLTFEAGNVNQLIGRLHELKQKPSLMKSMALNSKSIYERKFVADTVYAQMARHIEEVARKYGHL